MNFKDYNAMGCFKKIYFLCLSMIIIVIYFLKILKLLEIIIIKIPIKSWELEVLPKGGLDNLL